MIQINGEAAKPAPITASRTHDRAGLATPKQFLQQGSGTARPGEMVALPGWPQAAPGWFGAAF